MKIFINNDFNENFNLKYSTSLRKRWVSGYPNGFLAVLNASRGYFKRIALTHLSNWFSASIVVCCMLSSAPWVSLSWRLTENDDDGDDDEDDDRVDISKTNANSQCRNRNNLLVVNVRNTINLIPCRPLFIYFLHRTYIYIRFDLPTKGP